MLGDMLDSLQTAGFYDAGFPIGMGAGAGLQWPEDEACYLYTVSTNANEDAAMEAVKSDAAASVTSDIELAASSTYYISKYGVSPFGTMGAAQSVTLTTDGDGNLSYPAGNTVTDLTATPIAGGKFRLKWSYDSTDQPAYPTGFKIYKSSLLGTKHYFGENKKTYTTEAYAHGTSCTFEVATYRTVSGTDYENPTRASVTATADATGPDALTSLTASV